MQSAYRSFFECARLAVDSLSSTHISSVKILCDFFQVVRQKLSCRCLYSRTYKFIWSIWWSLCACFWSQRRILRNPPVIYFVVIVSPFTAIFCWSSFSVTMLDAHARGAFEFGVRYVHASFFRHRNPYWPWHQVFQCKLYRQFSLKPDVRIGILAFAIPHRASSSAQTETLHLIPLNPPWMNVFFRAKLGLIQTNEYETFCFDFRMHIYDELVTHLTAFQNLIVLILSNHKWEWIIFNHHLISIGTSPKKWWDFDGVS